MFETWRDPRKNGCAEKEYHVLTTSQRSLSLCQRSLGCRKIQPFAFGNKRRSRCQQHGHVYFYSLQCCHRRHYDELSSDTLSRKRRRRRRLCQRQSKYMQSSLETSLYGRARSPKCLQPNKYEYQRRYRLLS